MNAGRQPIHAPPDYAATLDEVAEVLGLSRERVRQIEGRALLKVRLALERRGIDADLVREYLDGLKEGAVSD